MRIFKKIFYGGVLLQLTFAMHGASNSDMQQLLRTAKSWRSDNNTITSEIKVFFNKNKEADPNACNNKGQTLLHLCALKNNAPAITFLINKKANPKLQDASLNTPLHLAALRLNEDAIYTLLQHDTTDCMTLQNKDGKTPLSIAACQCGQTTSDMLKAIKYNSKIINTTDNNNTSPLHLTASHGKIALTETLLESGANPNIKDEAKGRTALHWVQRMAQGSKFKGGKQMSREASLEMIELLLNYEANPTIEDKNGMTPIDWAKQRKSTQKSKKFDTKELDLYKQWLNDRNTTPNKPAQKTTSTPNDDDGWIVVKRRK